MKHQICFILYNLVAPNKLLQVYTINTLIGKYCISVSIYNFALIILLL